MPDHRRNRMADGSYFFTVNLLDRRSDLLVSAIGVLRDAVRQTRARCPFHIDAWVVLPDPTCIVSGRCRRVTPISRCDGG